MDGRWAWVGNRDVDGRWRWSPAGRCCQLPCAHAAHSGGARRCWLAPAPTGLRKACRASARAPGPERPRSSPSRSRAASLPPPRLRCDSSVLTGGVVPSTATSSPTTSSSTQPRRRGAPPSSGSAWPGARSGLTPMSHRTELYCAQGVVVRSYTFL
jgi:hypothetical protein